MRHGANPQTFLEKTCLSEVLQLMHVEGSMNGNRYQWTHFFEPSQDLMDEFEQLASKEPEII